MKQDFIQSALRWGVGTEVPPHLERWWREFREPVRPVDTGQGRLCNRFWMGCRVSIFPEDLALVKQVRGRGFIGISTARSSVLVQGGRGRSALEVVAGLGVGLESLSGLGRAELNGLYLGKNLWISLGRRLSLSEQLAVMEVGNWVGGIKGLGNGEFKLGSRTLAATPWRLFLALTLIKLAVKSHRLLQQGWNGEWKEKVHNLLALWKSRDDDARLALWVWVRRGLKETPAEQIGAFEPLNTAWSLSGRRWVGFEGNGRFLASRVVPGEEDILHARELVTLDTSLQHFQPAKVLVVPNNRHWVPLEVKPSMRELAVAWRDMCSEVGIRFDVVGDRILYVPTSWPWKEIQNRLQGIQVRLSGGVRDLFLYQDWAEDKTKLREIGRVFLELGLFRSVWNRETPRTPKPLPNNTKWSRAIKP